MSDMEQAVEAVDSAEPVGSEQSVVDTTDAGVAEASEPFFTWKDEESGEETAFSKPAELADFLRHSGMRKKQVEAEMQKISERAKRLEEMEGRYREKESLSERLANKYQPIDELMRNNPQFEQAVTQLYDRIVKGGGQQGARDPKELIKGVLKEELKPFEEFKSEYEKEKEQRAAQEKRQRAIERIRQNDPQFDEGLIENYLKRFEEYPEDEQQYAALQVAWDAVRGTMGAAELERRQARAKQKSPSLTSTPGAKDAEIDVTKMSPEELRAAALKEING